MNKLPEDIRNYRNFLAHRFLRGIGIEIGAGINPVLFDPARAQVKYVDYAPLSIIRETYESVPMDFVSPDIIDDGGVLSKFHDASMDFIVSCHMLEHTEDPIGVMLTWVKKVKKNGVMLVVIPDKRMCFDKVRPLTDLYHFVKDHEDGGLSSRKGHFLEVAHFGYPGDAPEMRARELEQKDYRIHFHTWEQESFLDFIMLFKREYANVTIEHFGRNHTELTAVLRV